MFSINGSESRQAAGSQFAITMSRGDNRMSYRIALAALLLGFVISCSSSNNSPTAPSPSGNGTAASIVSGASTLTTTAYAPNPVSVPVGGTVTWTNNDSTTHTSTSTTGMWDSGNIAPGAKFSMTFPTAGSFPYRCSIHPGMVGTVNVQ
jgi:plastocyanin